jgi:hypothetical protein
MRGFRGLRLWDMAASDDGKQPYPTGAGSTVYRNGAPAAGYGCNGRPALNSEALAARPASLVNSRRQIRVFVGPTSGLADGDRASSGEDGCVWRLSTLVVTDRADAIDVLAGFREQLYQRMTADAVFELTPCCSPTGRSRRWSGLSLAPEHRRGHGAMYDALNHDRGRHDDHLCAAPAARRPADRRGPMAGRRPRHPHRARRRLRRPGSACRWNSSAGGAPTGCCAVRPDHASTSYWVAGRSSPAVSSSVVAPPPGTSGTRSPAPSSMAR